MSPLIIFVDGDCAMCNAWATFVVRRESRSLIGTLQGRAAQHQLAGVPDAAGLRSIVVVDSGRVLTESTAVLRILRELPWPWRLLGVAAVVPRRLRDAVYRSVARRRHLVFRGPAVCELLPPEQRRRFLD